MGRNIWFTLTFKNDERVIRKAVEGHAQLVSEWLQESRDPEFETQAYFQPLPAVAATHAAEKGGNIVGLDDLKDNAQIFLGSLAVNTVDQEAIGRKKMLAWKASLEKYSKSVRANVKYRYINYADAWQDVLASY